ncbi:prepilin-type N-terminal cleavage/methylation domain-containing protein [Levilactobacillus acidifarinae]|nr:prepilin-type N-terminal cleavage/methylation domain-containing protein [Levilactobacillus acidifarinae]
MTSARGFTLVEGLLALSIAALLLGLVTGWSPNVLRPLRTDASELYTALAALEQPGRFTLATVQAETLTLVDHQAAKRATHEKLVTLSVDSRGTLKLTNPHNQGYLPLLRHVQKVKFTKTRTKKLVRLKIKQEGQKWQNTLLDLRGPTTAF